MPLPNTTGPEKTFKKQSLWFGVLEADMPSAGAVAAAGAATLNQANGVVTSEALVTLAAAFYTLTLTNSLIDANTILMVQASRGTGPAATTQGHPGVSNIECSAGQAVISIVNDDAAAAFNGTIKLSFVAIRKAPASL